MTYVELIVVLSIFTIMTAVVMFNYGAFQGKVDVKSLATDIALRIVEAQKSSISGKWRSGASGNWRPSYGAYFNASPNNSFIYFVDLDSDYILDGASCSGECIDAPLITKGSYIYSIEKYSGSTLVGSVSTPISITFRRPESKATFATASDVALSGFDSLKITVVTSKGFTGGPNAIIKVYSSGRIEVL